MRSSVIIAMGMIAICAPASAEDAYRPPATGTMVTWSFGDASGRETRISEVVAAGDDFVIYLSDLRLSEAVASSYIVEFSGIHVLSCADEMPSMEQRERLMSAWPLKSGETLEISGAMDATYTIGPLSQHTLNANEGPTDVRVIKATFGRVENDITLSLNWNMPVAVGWPDGTGDRALEVLAPTDARVQNPETVRALGNCAGLLDE